jgi:5'(3')-deoxyribonucleotidase
MEQLVFVDMDGVLADFDGQVDALGRFIKEPNFFLHLAPLPFARILNKQLAEDEEAREITHILSASPNHMGDQAKRDWLKIYIPNLKEENIIIVRGGIGNKAAVEKAKYAKGNILIDDYTANLIHWESKGGIGIKFLNGKNGKKKQWKGTIMSV